MEFPTIDMTSWFYKNCKQQRRSGAKICQSCPFRAGIEQQEADYVSGVSNSVPQSGQIKE